MTNTEFLGFGPERIELPVREFLAFNAASDGGAAHPEFSYRLVQLLRRQIRMLQRESGHSHESVRIPGAPLGDFFILQLDEVSSQGPVRRVRPGVHVDRLIVDTLRVHIDQSLRVAEAMLPVRFACAVVARLVSLTRSQTSGTKQCE